MIDATIISAPEQRNTREENEAIKVDQTPTAGRTNQPKRRRRTGMPGGRRSTGKSYYGYKNHIDVDHKLIRRYAETDASVHDTQQLDQLLDRSNTGSEVWAGTEIARDRNWMQRLGWKYIMPLIGPILPGVRSLKRSSADLLWLLTDAEVQSISGGYVDGREVLRGSLESRDRKKIARSVEVAKWIIDDRLYNKRVQQRALS